MDLGDHKGRRLQNTILSYQYSMNTTLTTLEVVNIKCGGCAKSIISALEKIGCTEISVSPDTQVIAFHSSPEKKLEAQKILEDLGYPEKNSDAANSLLKKAKSYASCAVGKFL